MKVLVVDDNNDDRMLLRLIVERQGHEVIEGENGQEGYELAVRHRPGLILSDALMPVLDGFHFLRRIKQDPELVSTPFIFYSATYTEQQDQAMAKALGAAGYIIKPKEPGELWRAVEEIVQKACPIAEDLPVMVGDEEYLRQYSSMLATKLEQKVSELEQVLAAKAETEKALVRAKEEWERSFEAIGDIAMILSPDLRIIRANRRAQEFFQDTGKDGVEGAFCFHAFQKESPCPDCPALLARKDGTAHTMEVEYRELGRTFQLTSSPVLDAQGGVMSIIHFAKDITAQKKLEKRLLQNQKLEAIGTLAGGIAHDFNNILTPILGYAEILKAAPPQEERIQEYADQIFTAAQRARELVRQILAFSRQQEHHPMPMLPHLIIKEALKLLRSTIPTSIEIRQDIQEDCGMVLADATRLHQVIMNLCTNAYQAMRGSTGVLSVTLRPLRLDHGDSKADDFPLLPGNFVVLEVSDTGCGMDKETMAKIFDPYFTTKKQDEGTGLGLSVVHGIVQGCGGHISVSSEPGKGSTFLVYLPRVEGQALDEDASDQLPLPSGSERILVVDDDPAVIALETKNLSINNHDFIQHDHRSRQ